MRIGVDLSLRNRSAAAAPSAPPQLSDPNVTGIGVDGWRAGYTNPGTFDPEGDPRLVVVTREGFDAQGQAHAFQDPLVIMGRVREPYPNEATMTPSDVSLSDFVYSGESVPGMANNSTRPYPKPQAIWLNHDLDVADSATYRVRMAVAHPHAQNGRPVAAVRFIASDGVNTTEVLSTQTDIATYAASGLSVPHFYADLDFSGLDAGALVTVDAEIRPWIGPSFLLSTDADAYPSVNLTLLKVLNNRDGSYGQSYAYVDAASGNDGSGVASAVATTAEAAPFATVGAAALAISTHNAATNSRTGVSGGIIRLQPGVHTHQSLGTHAVTEVPLIIESANPALKAGTIYQDAGASVANGLPDKTKFRNLTMRRNAAGAAIFLDSAAFSGSENMLVVEGCTWDDSGLGAPWNAWIYRVGRFWNIDCDGQNLGQCKQFSTDFKACICIGSGEGSLQSFTYHAVGCRDLDAFMFDNSVSGNVQQPRGDFLGWNHFGQPTNAERALNLLRQIDDRGVAVVGNVFEHFGGTTGPVYCISADGIVETTENVTIMCNTVVGSRTNLLYQDAGSARVDKYGRCRFNVDLLWNSKDDAFLPQNGNRVGNWAFQYRVGFRSNAILEGSNKGTDFGPGDAWLGELGALGDISGSPTTPINADWADDQSFGAGAGGNGDYSPGPAHQLPLIPPGLAPYAHDQAGRPILDNGTAVVGAKQPV